MWIKKHFLRLVVENYLYQIVANKIMNEKYNVYLISDSTGETLDRIFLALKAQFPNLQYETNHFSFTRTESQTLSILKQAKKEKNSIILYTIVNSKLAKYLTEKAYERDIPCFGVLGDLILNFSKVLNQKASHEPSGQHILNEEYYDRIDAIQFTMNHDDGNQIDDIEKSDIILLGVSRTSKTPTSIYLANRGFKTSNIPLVNKDSIPTKVTEKNFSPCIVGLVTEPERLYELRKNRLTSLKEDQNSEYVNIEKIQDELNNARRIFKENNWPTIDVTRKSVEETAASVIKIYEIRNKKNA